MFSQDHDTVELTMTKADHDLLLLVLGYALGAASTLRSVIKPSVMIGLVNRLEEGNPNFRPYDARAAGE